VEGIMGQLKWVSGTCKCSALANAAHSNSPLKRRKSGADEGGLTHIMRLLHQTSRIGGTQVLQRGLKINANCSVKYEKKKFTHWWYAKNSRYKPFKTTIYPEKKKYKCAKCMGIACNFADLTKGKEWDLFLL